MTPSDGSRMGWRRLEDTLLAVKVGEMVAVETLAAETGLPHETLERVLEELTRTELFERRGAGVFARRSLWQTAALERRHMDRRALRG